MAWQADGLFQLVRVVFVLYIPPGVVFGGPGDVAVLIGEGIGQAQVATVVESGRSSISGAVPVLARCLAVSEWW